MPAALAPDCRPSAPVSVIVVNGTDDPIVPYRGGTVRVGVVGFGKVLSTDETMALWAQANGCGPPSPAAALPIETAATARARCRSTTPTAGARDCA
ncbi:MAG: hypothetical protein U1F37_05470 [Alphaproteobacteria bacterium]